MRISDWSSDVCSSDLTQFYLSRRFEGADPRNDFEGYTLTDAVVRYQTDFGGVSLAVQNLFDEQYISYASDTQRSEEHTSELQSLMRISYAVFCLKKTKKYRLHQRTRSTTNIRHRKESKG